MTRSQFIEQSLRQIYGGQPTDDASITPNLVNQWLDQAIATAAKTNYVDAIKMDGVGYVNNSFYTKFKNITVLPDEQFTYKITLPQLPVGVGANEGIGTLQFIDEDGNVSLPCVPLTQHQVTYFETMRPIPNKILFFSEGTFIYAKTTLLLNLYTASVRMVSGGDSTDLNSTLNVPSDYHPIMVEYIKAQLGFERAQVNDGANDGVDKK